MNYEIIEYTPEFRNEVLQLQSHLWSSDLAANAEYMKWKYEQNPYLEKPFLHLALCAGKVVGMRGAYGAKWQIGDPAEIFFGPCAADFVIAPDHRRSGVFTKIIAAAVRSLRARGYPYVFNLSPNPVTRTGSLLMGWRTVGDLQPMRWRRWSRIVPRRLRRHAARLASRVAVKDGNPFRFLDSACCRGKTDSHVTVEQTARPEAMAALVERIGGDGRLRHVKDQAYFGWRFGNPRSAYRFLFWIDLRLEGYLVLQAKLYRDRARINIVDWEAASMRVRADLLDAVIRGGHFAELNIWAATFSQETQRLLTRAGFDAAKNPASATGNYPAILAKALGDRAAKDEWTVGGRRLTDVADWDLQMIYSDSY